MLVISLSYKKRYLSEHYVQKRIRRDLYEKFVEWCGETSINICLEKALDVLLSSRASLESKLSEPVSKQLADPPSAAEEKVRDMLRRVTRLLSELGDEVRGLGERVARLEGRASRLEERVAELDEWVSKIIDAINRLEADLSSVEYELFTRGREPIECSSGKGIEVCIYDVPENKAGSKP
jgi:hypothetical protein